MNKTKNQKAWLLVLPVFALVAFSAIIPLMTVVNYSVQDIFGIDDRVFVGKEWYQEILRDEVLHGAFKRQLIFSALVLLIEIPLGIAVALSLPRRGFGSSLAITLVAIPLLVPWNVVGTVWQVFARTDIGLGGSLLLSFGIDYNYTSNPFDAWITVLIMDIWHWTSLVVLLCFARLQSIPNVYYQAARIDGASLWSIFRFIQLPKMKEVLLLAVLLRFIDSFLIYTEPFVLTGGGPGNATTFLSQYLTQLAVGQFDLGPAAAFSIIYFLIILLFSWLFFTALTSQQEEKLEKTREN
ncbi:ABC transporter permease [Spirochaetota bacterium]|nr:ABC transporter permease [Spirochaetota bacterium]